ncbi:MAG TPA: hypothetical protein V6C76_07530 [Drouetiella sp.]
MRLKQTALALSLLLLSTSLPVQAGSFNSVKSESSDTVSDAPKRVTEPGYTAQGFPEISLGFMFPSGCNFWTNSQNNSEQRSSGYLATVDGRPTHDLGRSEIIKLLHGAVGSRVQIGFLNSDCELETVELMRKPELKGYEGEPPRKISFSETCHHFDLYGPELDWNPKIKSSEGYIDKNLTVVARANIFDYLKRAQTAAGSDDAYRASEAANAICYLDELGAFNEADNLIPMAEAKFTYDLHNPSFQETHSVRLIKELVNTQKFRDAEFFCRKFLALDGSTDNRDQTLVYKKLNIETDVKELLANLYLAENRKEESANLVKEIADSPYLGRSQYQSNYEYWGGTMYEKLGMPDKAEKFFERKLLAQKEKQKREDDGSQTEREALDSAHAQALLSYYLAVARHKLGHIEDATAALDQAAENYDKLIKEKNRPSIESQCMFFPTKPDLIKARQAIARGEEPPAVPVDSIDNFAEDFKLLQVCLSGNGHKKSDSQRVNHLIDLFSTRTTLLPLMPINRRPLNMFSALTQLARTLADNGQTQESNLLLRKINQIASERADNEVVKIEPTVELAVNAETSKQNPTSEWDEVLRSFNNSDCFWSDLTEPEYASTKEQLKHLEALRMLANIYSKGHEDRRAKILMNRAVDISKSFNKKHLADPERNALIRAEVILWLDKAAMLGREDNVDQALKVATAAIQKCCKSRPTNQKEIDHAFEQAYQNKVAEIGRICASNAPHSIDVLKFLELAHNTTDSGATKFVNDSDAFDYRASAPLVDEILAEELLRFNKKEEAYQAIQRAIKARRTAETASSLLLAGSIAEQSKHYADAADFYIRATEFYSAYFDNRISYESLLDVLRRAKECASSSSSDGKLVVNIALRLGSKLEYSTLGKKEALENLEFAYPLIDDKDRRKSSLLQHISMLKGQVPAEEKQKLKAAENESSEAPTSTEVARKTAAREVAVLRRSAQLAEKANIDTFNQYLNLAGAEARADQPDAAYKDAQTAIAQYKKPNDYGFWERSSLLPAGDTFDIPDSLRAVGHTRVAQSLLDLARKRTIEVYGEQSPKVAFALVNELNYAASDLDSKVILAIFDKLLKIPVRMLEVGLYESPQTHFDKFIVNLQTAHQSELALTILEKLLTAQRQQLDNDDYRIGNTLIQIASVQKDLGKYNQAYESLRDAIKIQCKFDGFSAIAKHYDLWNEILPKAGRAGYNTWVRFGPYHANACIPLMHEFGFEHEVELIERDGKIPDEYCGSENPQLASRDISTDELQKQADTAYKVVPYGKLVFEANEELLRLYKEKSDWEKLKHASIKLIDIYERSPASNAGRTNGCVGPATTRIDYYLAAAKADFKLGSRENAKQWIARAEEKLPELSAWEYSRLAAIDIEIADKENAKRHLDSAVALIGSWDGVDYDIPLMFKKVGLVSESAAAQAKFDKMRADTELANKKAEEFDVFRGSIF